jgi:signal transduction histidine kinase
MGAPSDDPITGESSTGDLGTFNRWLCISRLRAAGAVAAFAVVVSLLGVTTIDGVGVLAVCAALCVTSLIGLGWRRLCTAPVPFFYTQTVIDIIGITVGIGSSASGEVAVLFHLIYALVIVPASLFSALAGFTFATVATIGHEILLTLERGLTLRTLLSIESLVPTFLFYLVAQQAVFYGSHLHNKNRMLAALAGRLKESRQKLAAEGRLSAALVDAAQTLSATLDAPVLLDHLTRTTREHLCADWSATFLVDSERGVFRMAAATDAQIASTELSRIEFPIPSWSAVGRVTAHRVVVLTGEVAESTPEVFTGDRRLSTVLLAALHKDGDMVGFLAVGYTSILIESSDWALRLLAGIAEHATVVLHNAHLLEEVRQASALKSEFVGAISHELRSPLNVVLGYLEMALDGGLGPVAPEMADAFRRARRQSVELLELITALLDLNRLEAGRLPVHRTNVAIGELLQTIVQQLPENWQREGVEIRLDLADTLPVVETDAQKLKTVVRNLVHNALKFTERGHVTIGARVLHDGGLAITVADSGRGIPAEAVPYVFDMFRQVPGSGGGGVGLGLHIVQRFVEVLGGSVELSSEVGVGTCFTVTLPPGALTSDETRPATAPARAA